MRLSTKGRYAVMAMVDLAQHGTGEPIVRTGEVDITVDDMRLTVEEFYERAEDERATRIDLAMDAHLSEIFLTRKPREGRPAAAIVTKYRRELIDKITYWTGVRRPVVRGLVEAICKNCERLKLWGVVGQEPTYLVALLHGLILAAGVVILMRAGRRLWQERARWREMWIGRHSPTAFTQNAALWGFGMLLTASCLPINRHYMITTFPLMFLWLARMALARIPNCETRHAENGRQPATHNQQPRRYMHLAVSCIPRSIFPYPAFAICSGRLLLLVLCLTQFLISASFLGYVHVNQRIIRGDYGLPYAAQEYPRPSALVAGQPGHPAFRPVRY